MRRAVRILAALALIGALGAAAVIGVGLYNVSARQAHWPGVAWVLHTTYRQSVRLRAPAADTVPTDLADPDRILLGALHFRTACAFCHSIPGEPRSATATAMVPSPPHIVDAVADWQPRHLFWIVREGVKMSGMPHWPAAGRDDEVWSVVAYLDAVRGPDGPGRALLTDSAPGPATCVQCHGELGESGNPLIPRLDTLTTAQIVDALAQYRDGTRPSGFMKEAAGKLSDQQIEHLAAEFGAGSVPRVIMSARDRQEPGWQLATRGNTDIPACAECHGPDRRADAPIAPSLAGQSRAYLEAQLRLWRDGARGGGDRAELMLKVARQLTDNDIRTLADWYAGLSFEPFATRH